MSSVNKFSLSSVFEDESLRRFFFCNTGRLFYRVPSARQLSWMIPTDAEFLGD